MCSPSFGDFMLSLVDYDISKIEFRQLQRFSDVWLVLIELIWAKGGKTINDSAAER